MPARASTDRQRPSVAGTSPTRSIATAGKPSWRARSIAVFGNGRAVALHKFWPEERDAFVALVPLPKEGRDAAGMSGIDICCVDPALGAIAARPWGYLRRLWLF